MTISPKIPLLALFTLCALACSKKSASPSSGNAPKLTVVAIIPASGSYNTLDTIVGTAFSTGDSVWYNKVAATIQYVSADTLIVKVPLGAGTGPVTISGGGSTVVGPTFNYVLTAVVSTLAGGNSSGGFSDGQGSAAAFNYPVGIVLDAQGNLIVADCFNDRIRKVTPGGLVTTIAGNGTHGLVNGAAADAEFWWPQGITIDGSGNLYIGDNQNDVIRKITPADSVTTYAGNGTQGFVNGAAANAEFYLPSGVTMDKQGNLYVADANNCAIRMISPAGMVSTLSGTGTLGYVDGPIGTAAFHAPAGVTMDGQGNLYVADTYNSVIREITPGGQVSTIAGNGTGGFQDGMYQNAEFLQPQSMAIDSAGNILVGDYGNAKVRKIGTDGVVSTLAGTGIHSLTDGPVTIATFYSPWSIAIGPGGIVYVADSRNNAIRKISME